MRRSESKNLSLVAHTHPEDYEVMYSNAGFRARGNANVPSAQDGINTASERARVLGNFKRRTLRDAIISKDQYVFYSKGTRINVNRSFPKKK